MFALPPLSDFSASLYDVHLNNSQQCTLWVKCLLISLSYAVALFIERGPTNLNVLAPNPVNLTCTAKGKPSPDIVWIKEVNGDQMKYFQSQDRLNIATVQRTGMSTSTLTISPTGALDTATYSCMAENVNGNIYSVPAEVTVFGEYVIYFMV